MCKTQRGTCLHACYAGTVEGFAVSGPGTASLLWSAAFPPDKEAVLGLAAPAPNAPIYSYAKASPHPYPSHMVTLRTSLSYGDTQDIRQ